MRTFCTVSINSCLFSDALSSDKVCSLVGKKRKIKLEEQEESSIIVKEIRSFDDWSGVFEYSCRFEVKSKNKDGVIAVIQNLSFRASESGCIDYIQVNKHV
jgi:hypothetical protein